MYIVFGIYFVVLVRPRSVEVSGVRHHTVEGSTVNLVCEVSDRKILLKPNYFLFQLPHFFFIKRVSDVFNSE